MEPDTLEDVLQQARKRFQRHASEFDTIVESNLPTWVDRLSKLFPWWFLTTNPGQLLPNSFPLSSPLASQTPKAGAWLDVGWLRVQPGVRVYDIKTVKDEGRYASTPSDATLWTDIQCQEVRYVYEFDKDGNFLQKMDLSDDTSAMVFMSYQKTTRPVQVMWRRLETKSQLMFDPVPDAYYLYACSFTEGSPGWYTLDNGTTYRNKWTSFCPEALVQYIIWESSQYFDEPGLRALAERALFGSPPNINLGRRKKEFVGLLDDLKEATILAQQTKERAVFYPDERNATGFGGTYQPLTTLQKFQSPYWRRRLF